MASLSQDRLVRKEVALGMIREFEPPQDHIGTRLFAPFQSVESDDVIFQYSQGLTAGLAPARAEDAESELARKDFTLGEGRASILDWALKDHYSASDVTRYREAVYLAGQVPESLPLTVRSMTEDFQAKLARDTRIRRRKLDNRIEWLIMSALSAGSVTYDDGTIKFTVDYGRPNAQNTGNLPGGASATPWSSTSSDPIGDILAVKEYMYDTYNVTVDRALVSQKIVNNMLKSDKFTNSLIGSNPLYTVTGWGVDAARQIIRQATDMDFIVYDSVYRTKPWGSNTITNNRFFPQDKMLFLPSAASVNNVDDAIGFGKTLTSPHPEGNWQSGFYAWEQDTKDPWGYDVGNGIKAFPVLPHLDMTYLLKVI